ncbi:MAG: caspase family protein [Intrasporangium sp.]|uniref:caspase family protein n=1 Tax=Intrasporangium sp. TaxID=1925024 RepID=UPI00264940E4|nr:caspase family protein [Intrasporangium sp.]MDN5794980.1 caspase family protein [Intrasporangium sp.]
MAKLRALLVGIDAYPQPVPALAGCVNDITEMETTLRGRVPPDALDLRVLTDAAATRSAVIEAIQQHLGSAGPDDVALFCFSGHGSQQEAPAEAWPLEPDRRNETIVLFDSRTPGAWDLADKELAAILRPVASRALHVLVVLDCCHSGDGTRDLSPNARIRLAPTDARPRPWATFVTGARSAASDLGGAGGHVLLAACRSSETAKETTVDGRQRGALSAVLGRALRECEGQPTYRDIHRLVTAGVSGLVANQHPQLETADATDLDRVFLGGTVTPRPRQLTLAHSTDGWSVDAGAVHGMPEPIGDDTTELAVYPQDGATDAVPLATATVTQVLPDRSLVDVSPDLDTSAFFRAVVTSIPLPPLRIGLIGASASSLPTDAADPTLVTFVNDPAGADVLVRADAGGFTILRPGVARPVVVLTGPDRDRRTITALERVARWLRLSALHNPATQLPPGVLEVGLSTSAGSVGPDGRLVLTYAAQLAPAFTVTLRNTGSVTLWCALVDLTEAYGIFTDAFPAGTIGLGPGESSEVALTGQVSDDLWQAGTTSVTDHLKVIVSTLEFDPRSLQQPELDVEDGSSVRSLTEPRSTLDRLLTAVSTRRVQPTGAPQPVADWRTTDVLVTTHRPR